VPPHAKEMQRFLGREFAVVALELLLNFASVLSAAAAVVADGPDGSVAFAAELNKFAFRQSKAMTGGGGLGVFERAGLVTPDASLIRSTVEAALMLLVMERRRTVS